MGIQRLRICLCLVAALSVAALSQEQSFHRFDITEARPFSQTGSSHFQGVSNQRPLEEFRQPAKHPRPHIRRPVQQNFDSNDGFHFVDRQQNVFPAPAVQQPAAPNFAPQQSAFAAQQPAFAPQQHRQTAVPQHQQSFQQGQTGFVAPQQTLRPVSLEQLNAQRAQTFRHPQGGNFQQSQQRQTARPVSRPQAAPIQGDTFQSFQQPVPTPIRQHQPTIQQPIIAADPAIRHNQAQNLPVRGPGVETHQFQGSPQESQQPPSEEQQRHPSSGRRPSSELSDDELIQKKQAENAKYSFQTSVTDTINDHQIVRQEKRDGLKLTGVYSYSDGFYKRTVFYEADENGYRVVKEESEPIGSGPQLNPDGKIDVNTNIGGSSLQYTVTANDIPALSSDTAELPPRQHSTFV